MQRLAAPSCPSTPPARAAASAVAHSPCFMPSVPHQAGTAAAVVAPHFASVQLAGSCRPSPFRLDSRQSCPWAAPLAAPAAAPPQHAASAHALNTLPPPAAADAAACERSTSVASWLSGWARMEAQQRSSSSATAELAVDVGLPLRRAAAASGGDRRGSAPPIVAGGVCKRTRRSIPLVQNERLDSLMLEALLAEREQSLLAAVRQLQQLRAERRLAQHAEPGAALLP